MGGEHRVSHQVEGVKGEGHAGADALGLSVGEHRGLSCTTSQH